MSSLAQAGVNAAAASLIGVAARIVIQTAAQITLARILGPESVGSFAVAAILLGFALLIADFGVAYSIQQKPQIHPSDISFAFTSQLLTGAVVMVMLFLFAPTLAHLFGKPDSANLLQSLAPVALLQAAASTSQNMMKRELRFRALTLSQLVSYAIGYVAVGIPLALKGFGPLSLVIAWLVQASTLMVFSLRLARQPLTLSLEAPDRAWMMQYARTVFATNLVNWGVTNLDRVLVGRLFSVRDLGIYQTAVSSVYGPGAATLSALQPVVLSTISRRDANLGALRDALQTVIYIACSTILPAFACLALLATAVEQAVFGAKWVGLARVLAPVSLSIGFFVCWGMTTPFLWVRGRRSAEWMTQIPFAGACAIALVALYPKGLTAVAWSVAVLGAIRWAAVIGLSLRRVGIESHEFLRLVVAPIFLCSLLIISAWACTWTAKTSGLSAFGTLSVTALVMATLWVFLVVVQGIGMPAVLRNALLVRLGRRRTF